MRVFFQKEDRYLFLNYPVRPCCHSDRRYSSTVSRRLVICATTKVNFGEKLSKVSPESNLCRRDSLRTRISSEEPFAKHSCSAIAYKRCKIVRNACSPQTFSDLRSNPRSASRLKGSKNRSTCLHDL